MKRRHLRVALTVTLAAGILVAASPAEAAPSCFGKRATIVGTSGDDEIKGTNGDDVIHGLAGRDVINGRGGDDLICGGKGGPAPRFRRYEYLGGGSGNDKIRGQGGHDYASGGRGNDVVSGGGRSDFMLGGPGNDVLRGGRGADDLNGHEGRDRLYGGPGSETSMVGGDGADRMKGGTGDDYLAGELDYNRKVSERRPGNDFIGGGRGRDWVMTSEHPKVTFNLRRGYARGRGIGTDRLRSIENARGSNDHDRFLGDRRPNHFMGFNGRDVMHGRAGHDVLEGWNQADEIRGGYGRDQIFPDSTESDVVDGGPGLDLLIFATFTAELYDPAEACFSDSTAGWVVDIAAGSATRSDATIELAGIEDVIGSPWDDEIYGDDANNYLRGLCGDDHLDGRGGYDTLVGDDGVDSCTNGEQQEGCES